LFILRERLLQPATILTNQDATTPENNITSPLADLEKSTPDDNQTTVSNGSVHDFEVNKTK